MCLGAMNLWLDSIWKGNIPCNLQNSAIDVALRNLHQYLDRELEKEAERIAENVLGRENIEARIDKFERLSSLLSSRPDCGEIDILAVNKSLKIVYVLDAKNRNPKIRPSDIRREIEDFFDGKRSYLAQLTKKENFIQDNLEQVLKHFSVEDIEGWHVRKAFVVKENYPSAYCPDRNVDFVLVDDLEEYLTQIEREDNGNKHQRAQLYTNDGIFSLQKGDYQEALASFEKAQNIFMKLELREMIWQILKYKLECYIRMGNRHDCIKNLSEMFKSSYKEELVEKTIECLIRFVSILVNNLEWEFLSRIVEISSSIMDFDLQYFFEALSEFGKVKLGKASMKDFEVKISKIKNEDLLDFLDWLVILDPSWDNSWQL
jgi:tetratricopeptide (TPR) repeat protein